MKEYSPDMVVAGYHLIDEHLQGAGLSPAPIPNISLETLKAWLEKAVQELLDRDLEKLLRICYRIDLPEAKVNHILSFSVPDQMAPQFAELIIQRELQKVYFRQKYREE